MKPKNESIKEEIAKEYGIKDLDHEFFINGSPIGDVLEQAIKEAISSERASFKKEKWKIWEKFEKYDGKYPHIQAVLALGEKEHAYKLMKEKEEIKQALKTLCGVKDLR